MVAERDYVIWHRPAPSSLRYSTLGGSCAISTETSAQLCVSLTSGEGTFYATNFAVDAYTAVTPHLAGISCIPIPKPCFHSSQNAHLHHKLRIWPFKP